MSGLVGLLEILQGKIDRFRKGGLKETPTRTIFIDPLARTLSAVRPVLPCLETRGG
jgi:hypothetical protein